MVIKVGPRIGWATTATYFGLFWLCGSGHALDSFEVSMNRKVQSVFLNDNVTLPCKFSGYGSLPLGIIGIGVRWFWRRSDSAEEKEILEFNGRQQTCLREGASLSVSGLLQGNASLFLPSIQLQDEGEYKCEVIIPPNSAQGTVKLEVLASPSCMLLPPATEVEEKKEYNLKCNVIEFYPESVQIFWKKVIPVAQSWDTENISEDIFVYSIRNNDGTFNSTSLLILQPILEDNGTIYQCMVTHKSLLIPLQCNTTLIVTEIVTLTKWDIPSLIIFLSFCFLCLFFVKPFAKEVPVLSPLPEIQYLKHQESKTFSFVIWGYKPKFLVLKFFLNTDPLGKKNEKKLLFCWTTEDVEKEEKPESMQQMERQVGFILCPLVQYQRCGLFGVSFDFTIMPDLAKFTEGVLFLEVEHSSLKNPLRRRIHLKVIVPPKLKKIRCSSDNPQPGENVTLTCKIHSFFPKAVRVSWFKEGRRMLEGIETSEALEIQENAPLFSCTTQLTFSPQIEDLEKKFTCKAEVEGGEPVERHWVLPSGTR